MKLKRIKINWTKSTLRPGHMALFMGVSSRVVSDLVRGTIGEASIRGADGRGTKRVLSVKDGVLVYLGKRSTLRAASGHYRKKVPGRSGVKFLEDVCHNCGHCPGILREYKAYSLGIGLDGRFIQKAHDRHQARLWNTSL